MLLFDEAISTLQSSCQTIYGLFIGFMAVLSDLKEGKQVITSSSDPSTSSIPLPSSSSPSPPPTSTDQQQEQSTSRSSLESIVDGTDSELYCYVNTANEKDRALTIIKNVLALWHFVVNMLYLVKRAVAVKIHIADPEKIVINPMRVKKLTYRFHNYFMK